MIPENKEEKETGELEEEELDLKGAASQQDKDTEIEGEGKKSVEKSELRAHPQVESEIQPESTDELPVLEILAEVSCGLTNFNVVTKQVVFVLGRKRTSISRLYTRCN